MSDLFSFFFFFSEKERSFSRYIFLQVLYHSTMTPNKITLRLRVINNPGGVFDAPKHNGLCYFRSFCGGGFRSDLTVKN